ncbi:MAG: enoyl-CoA hydratase/carnithine racemase [Acidimicrobiales bacterium]
MLVEQSERWAADADGRSEKGRDRAGGKEVGLGSLHPWRPNAECHRAQHDQPTGHSEQRPVGHPHEENAPDQSGHATSHQPADLAEVGFAPVAYRVDDDRGEACDQNRLGQECGIDDDENREGEHDHAEPNTSLQNGASEERQAYDHEGQIDYVHRRTLDLKAVEYEQIRFEVVDRVATITLDRPERLNAFTEKMRHELLDAFDVIDADDGIRAVVMTGEGRGFCAGAELGERGGDTFNAKDQGKDPAIPNRDGGGTVSLRIFELTKPIIAAINGAAVGVGITMTLPMDIRLAVPDAKIGFVFARRGIVPEAVSSWFLPRVVGISKAAEWCYSGRVFSGTEAGEAGLVQVVEPADLLERAYAIAGEIATHAAPVSVALTRQMLWRGLTFDHPMESHRVDSRAIQALGAMTDAKEGVSSFLEKRDPEWKLSVANDTPDVFPKWSPPDFS